MNHVLTKILPTKAMILIKDHKTDQSMCYEVFLGPWQDGRLAPVF